MFDILKKYLCCYSVNVNAKIDQILDTIEMDVTIDRSRNNHHSFCVNEKSVHYINHDDKDSHHSDSEDEL